MYVLVTASSVPARGRDRGDVAEVVVVVFDAAADPVDLRGDGAAVEGPGRGPDDSASRDSSTAAFSGAAAAVVVVKRRVADPAVTSLGSTTTR